MSRLVATLKKLARITTDRLTRLPKDESSLYARQCLIEAEQQLLLALKLYGDAEMPAVEKERAITRAILLLSEAGLFAD